MIDSTTPFPSNLEMSLESADSHNTQAFDSSVRFVLNHLQRESEYLDTVIQSSLRMKDLLHRRPKSTKNALTTEPERAPTDASDPATSDINPFSGEVQPSGNLTDQLAPHEQLTALRSDLARQLVPILEGRQQMKSAIQVFQPLNSEPPTVTSLSPKLPEPARSQMKQLRNDIKLKLNEVRAITMGNQAVLVYTMDFYHRLLSGLSQDTSTVEAYNAEGKLNNQVGSGLLKKDC